MKGVFTTIKDFKITSQKVANLVANVVILLISLVMISGLFAAFVWIVTGIANMLGEWRNARNKQSRYD